MNEITRLLIKEKSEEYLAIQRYNKAIQVPFIEDEIKN